MNTVSSTATKVNRIIIIVRRTTATIIEIILMIMEIKINDVPVTF